MSGVFFVVVVVMVVLVKVAADEVSLSPVVMVEAGFALLLVLGSTPGLHLSVELARREPPCTIRQIWASVTASLPLPVPASFELSRCLAGAQLAAAVAVDLVATSTDSRSDLLGSWNDAGTRLALNSKPGLTLGQRNLIRLDEQTEHLCYHDPDPVGVGLTGLSPEGCRPLALLWHSLELETVPGTTRALSTHFVTVETTWKQRTVKVDKHEALLVSSLEKPSSLVGSYFTPTN